MTRLLLGSVALLASIGRAAHAADLAVVGPAMPAIIAPPTWDGLYGGINMGGRWFSEKISTTTTPATALDAPLVPLIDGNTPGTLNAAGLMGGLQAGYNWQFGNLVPGIEADANVVLGSSSRTVNVIQWTDSTKSPQFLATVRPRLGWAFDHRFLVYATAGYAFETAQLLDGPPVPVNANVRQSGWTAGAGFEYAFSRGVSAKVEYLYVGLGTVTSQETIITGNGPVPSVVNVKHDMSDNIIRAGLNFHLGY
jgi:outer membrane immunogenic protein